MTFGSDARAAAARWRIPANMMLRYAGIIGLALAEALAVFALQGSISHELRLLWQPTYKLETFERHVAAGLLPVPVAFALWLRALERNGRLALRFSPVMAVISVAGVAAMPFLYGHPHMMLYSLTLGVVAGLFAFAPPADFLRRAVRQPRLAIVALAAATASYVYYWLMEQPVTDSLLSWDGEAVSAVLNLFGMDTFFTENLDHWMVYNMYSKHFVMKMAPGCCGFEGIFLAMFMLSVVLLMDWERFQGRWLWPVYGLAAVLMFVVNLVRVAVLFSIGYWAYTPGMPQWVQSLQGAPMFLFHSYLGWIIDLFAFGCLALWLYRSTVKQEKGFGE